MDIIPLAAVPSQSITVLLNNQRARVNVYERIDVDANVQTPALFLDLYVSDVLIIGGVICRNAVKIVRNSYFGFIGDLAFFDLQAIDDPQYTGLGTRWVLGYITP